MTKAVHQEIQFDAAPRELYQALIDSTRHAAFTGGPAEISGDEGGAFSCHGGAIVGRNIELVENERIVQAWRVADWEPGIFSVVRITLSAEQGGSKLTLDHVGFPDGAGEHLAGGWHTRYWEPMREYLAS
jgi:activator of HSP90 ATPase